MTMLPSQPAVWTISGSDSRGIAGIAADLKAFHCFGVHGHLVITAVTTQSRHSFNAIQWIDIAPTLHAMQQERYPRIIKVGMLGTNKTIDVLREFLAGYTDTVVLDPVLFTTAGRALFDNQDYVEQLKTLLPYVTILTPNLYEAMQLLNCTITNESDMQQAAQDLLSLGARSVLIKGGHFTKDTDSADYWTDGQEAFWLGNKRQSSMLEGGTGCLLAAAIASALALGSNIKDALVMAKMFVHQAIRSGTPSWPVMDRDLPTVSAQRLVNPLSSFLPCKEHIGLYPIVENSEWLLKLLPLGIRTIQLRLKMQTQSIIQQEIKRAVCIAQTYHAQLFINDYWKEAIQYGAYGVHLGQGDLTTADLKQIHHAGLRLGVSTHSDYEMIRAQTVRPSYIAFGPIYETTSKALSFAPQGVQPLKKWCELLSCPVVAIGGIQLENIDSVLTAKVNGVAMIAAITKANDPILAAKQLLTKVKQAHAKHTII